MGGESKDPNKAAMDIQREQMARLEGLDLPELEEYILQNPELVGLLEAEQLEGSELNQIRTNPEMMQKQMLALEGLKERSEQGLTAQDRLDMENMMGQVGAQERSQRDSIESEMQRRGTADSGTSLMAKLNSSQGGANSARQQAMQMAAQGQNQRMSALQNMGQMAGSMDQADYARQANAASANDRIAQANAMNRQNVNASNLASQQNIENQRAGIANQQAQVGNQIAQQNFNNEYSRTGAQGQVTNAMAQTAANAPVKPGGLQAGLQGGLSGFAATGSPWGAAAGAGMGILSSMEDGGIAKSQQREMKEHDRFKNDYMKRVRQELTPQQESEKEVLGLKDGGVLKSEPIHAKDGFPDEVTLSSPPPEPNLTFDMSNLSMPSVTEPLQESLSTLSRPGIMDPSNAKERDIVSEIVENAQLAPEEDLSSKGASETDTKGLQKGLGALSEMLEQPKRKALTLPGYSQPQLKNIMKPVQSQQFNNPMEKFSSAFQDGGVPKYADGKQSMWQKMFSDGFTGTESESQEQSEYDKNQARRRRFLESRTPEQLREREAKIKAQGGYQDGGTPIYASDGMGDIIDSGMESYADDRVDAKVNDGEAILNIPQQQRMMDLIRGKIGVDELGDDDIVEGVPRSFRDEMHEDLESESEYGEKGESDKVSGLKRLLEALGE